MIHFHATTSIIKRCKLISGSIQSIKFCLFSLISSVLSINSYAQQNTAEYQFDTAFLYGVSNINLDQFILNGTLPGVYYTSVYLNQEKLYDVNIQVKSRDDGSTYACLSPDIVKSINLNFEQIPDEYIDGLTNYDGCLDLQTALPQTSVVYDSNETRLDISVPQIYYIKLARGEVNEASWESGITAGLINYSINGYNSDSNGTENQSVYASLNTGFNIGSWFFRQNGNLTWSKEDGAKYTSLNAFVQRDIKDIKGRITLGQINTQGQLFNSLPFTGAQLSSDDRMLPDSQRGYAPQIRGNAQTNARISVYQSNTLIYETTVPPGEFLINDLYPTGYGGDLDVVIQETDGSERRFSVPYESMTQLIRPGFHRYSLTAGVYRNDSLKDEPLLFEGTYQKGISNALTLYGGLQGNEDYQAVQAGAALGTFLGAISADVTHSHASFDEGYESKSGQSVQLRYSKNFTSTGSDLSLATSRHATKDYMDYRTAMERRDLIQQGKFPGVNYSPKNRFLITANQELPDGWGQFYASATIEDFWGQDGYTKQFQLGYNNSYGNVSVGLMASRTENLFGGNTTDYSANISLPIGGTEYTHRPQLRITLNQDNEGNSRQQANISGTLGDYNQFNYGLNLTNQTNASVATDVNVAYTGSLSKLTASYSVGDDYHSETLGVSGSMILHSGGITLSPYSGTTMALIEAKGAEGAEVSGYPGVEIDSNGYAILPYLSPYQMNDISIDPVSSDNDVELLTSNRSVAPYDKAVVLVKFEAKKGQSMLVTTKVNGEPVPFGSLVTDENDNVVGSVGQAGQIYARVEETSGRLLVTWGVTEPVQCYFDYEIDPDSNTMQQFDADCHILTVDSKQDE